MNVLALATVFPNASQPLHGLFVSRRLRHAGMLATVRVVAPIGWQVRQPLDAEPPTNGVRVIRPTFWYLPGIAKCLDGFFLFLSCVREVARLRRDADFDLIDAHFAFPDGFAAILLGRWFRRPVVITMRGNEIDYQRYVLRRAAIRWALRRAAAVIAVSGELAELAVREGVPRGRVSIIANGVDAEQFQIVDRRGARTTLGIGARTPLIVSVGHLVPRKGFHHLIEAVSRLREDNRDVHLAIVGGSAVGTGDYPESLRRLVDRLGMTSSVRFVGPLPPEGVALWLNAADLFVLASEREGCPNVVAEALACGCPVVTTAVGEAPAIVSPSGGAVVADAREPARLATVIDSVLARSWDRQEVRATIASRTWQRVAEQVLACWRTVLADRDTRRGDVPSFVPRSATAGEPALPRPQEPGDLVEQ